MKHDRRKRCLYKEREMAQDCPHYGKGARCSWNEPTPCPRYTEESEIEKKTDTLPSCNSCVHNGTWGCIKCSRFDQYERAR